MGIVPPVCGDAENPKWEVGDRWVYETPYYGACIKERKEVINITTINVNNTDYEVYVVKSSVSNWIADITTYGYYLINNLAIIKIEGVWDSGTNKTETVVIYDPPKQEYVFPLFVGKTWISTYKRSQESDISGSLNATDTLHYNVTGIETIKVKAGTFECYVIEESEGGGHVDNIIWYSPKVKNWVKRKENPRIIIETELISYKVAGLEENEFNFFSIPYLLFIILISVIIVALTVGLNTRRKRKNLNEVGTMIPVYYRGRSQETPPIIPATSPILSQSPDNYKTLDSSPKYICPSCGQLLSFIHRYHRWYCSYCENYIELDKRAT